MEGDATYLPSELWQLIFSRLGDGDLKAVSLVCKDFFTLSNCSKESLKVVHPRISILSRHLNRFTKLKAIDLSNFKGDIDKAICKIERSGISLEALYIPMEYEGSEECRRLRGFAPSLKALDCKFKSPLCVRTLKVIANTFPDLEQLRIDAPTRTYTSSRFGLRFDCSKLELLKKIHLSSCEVCDQFIIALSLKCVLLKDVSIDHSAHLTETGIAHLLRNRPNLEALSINGLGVDYSSPINLDNSIYSHAKALKSLLLCGIKHVDRVLKAIEMAKLGLYKLRLIGRRGLVEVRDGLTDEHVKEFVLNGNVSNLTYFEIGRGEVTSSTLFLLSTRCPSLVDVRIELNEQVDLGTIPLSKNQITSLLLSLSYRCKINDEFFKQLVLLFPNLKLLHLINFYSKFRLAGILKSCKQITELDLSHYYEETMFGSNDPELAELNLEVLTLPHSSVGDKEVGAIAKRCRRLLSLDLSDCSWITINGIKSVIRNIKTLTSLNLMDCDNLRYGALLDWMLSTGNLASLNKIFLPQEKFTREQKHKFLNHGCLLSSL